MEKTFIQNDQRIRAKHVEEFHHALQEAILNTRDAMHAVSFQEASDIGYFWKWIADMMDHCRKEADKLSKQAQAVAVDRWMQMPEQLRGDKIVMDEYTGVPDVEMSASIPSRTADPDNYDAFMKWLGLPQHLLDAGLMRVHWPTLAKKITELMAEGKPLPDGIDPTKTTPVKVMKYRARRAKK